MEETKEPDRHANWKQVPFDNLVSRDLTLNRVLSASIGLEAALPQLTYPRDIVERDGLGPWEMVCVENAAYGVVAVGNPEDAHADVGVMIWTNIEGSLESFANLLADIFRTRDIYVMNSETGETCRPD